MELRYISKVYLGYLWQAVKALGIFLAVWLTFQIAALLVAWIGLTLFYN